MSKITDYVALSSVQPDDVLPVVDVHDTTMAPSGTTKKITAAALLAGAGGIVPPAGDIGGTATAPTVTGTHLASPLPVGQGGTGASAQQAAIDTLTGTQSAGKVLRSDGTHATLAAIQAADVPVLNQNTTGTAANVTGTVAVANGGTGQTAQQGAINALTGTQSAGKYLRSDGTNASLAAIQAADVPTLNQSTTGTAANVTGTVAVANGGTGATTQQAALDALAGAQTSAQYLRGNGTHVAMSAVQAADLPAASTSAQGAVQFDTATPQPTSTTGSAGSGGKAQQSNHVHAQNYGGVFGDGSDGSVTLDGTTTFNNFSSLSSPGASGVYTLTRDVFATNLTVNSGITLVPSGWRIFCAGTFTNNGTVSAAGNAGNANGNGAAATGGGSFNGNNGGGNGTTTAGAAGISSSAPGLNTAGAGGAGASGAGGAAGTAGGTTTAPFKVPAAVLGGVFRFAGANVSLNGGPGGGGGGGDSTNKGGGGGGGGGCVAIFAWSAVNGGTITVAGGNGGTPTTGNTGGGGGGSGGVILAYTLSAWTAGTTTTSGGSGGGHAGTGSSGSAGGAGSVLNQLIA